MKILLPSKCHFLEKGGFLVQDITAVDIMDITADSSGAGAIKNNFDNVLIEKETYPTECDSSFGADCSLHLYGSLMLITMFHRISTSQPSYKHMILQ